MLAPCEPWPLDMSCWEFPGDEPAPETVERWRRVATQILWGLTGRRWGLCEVTVRPCLRNCSDAPMSAAMAPYTVGGRWYNATCCCAGECSCGGRLCEVRLEGPVHSIVEVLIDGQPVAPETYRVDAPGLLVRQSTDECWPPCQDLSMPPTEPGTFAVTYRQGLEPDEAAIAAVSEYTYELIKACIPDADCALPRRVTSVVRQGIRIDRVDARDYLDEGRVGLDLVDQWIASVNPYGLPSQGRVMSPDHRPPRRTTWDGRP